MRRDSGWRRNWDGRLAIILSLIALLLTLTDCASWWTAGAGAAGAPCVSDADSLRVRDSLGVCRATGRGR